ncbi:MAG: hypothetical protein SFH39_03855, partial [Candidatus Magnetobacterium sp. LHC-1]
LNHDIQKSQGKNGVMALFDMLKSTALGASRPKHEEVPLTPFYHAFLRGYPHTHVRDVTLNACETNSAFVLK